MTGHIRNQIFPCIWIKNTCSSIPSPVLDRRKHAPRFNLKLHHVHVMQKLFLFYKSISTTLTPPCSLIMLIITAPLTIQAEGNLVVLMARHLGGWRQWLVICRGSSVLGFFPKKINDGVQRVKPICSALLFLQRSISGTLPVLHFHGMGLESVMPSPP